MNCQTPHYLLHLDADRNEEPGRWRFALRTLEGSVVIEAGDTEPDVRGDRLDLLTAVRALETLDEPAKVTLVGCSRYIRQGMMYGLTEWRENGFRWECYGEMTPVKNADLWQRLDRALKYHEVICQLRRVDPAHTAVPATKVVGGPRHAAWGVRGSAKTWLKCTVELLGGTEFRQRVTAMLNQAVRWMLPHGRGAISSS